MRMPPRAVVAVSLAVAGTLPGDALLYAVLPIVWSELGLELWMVGVLLSANRFVRLITNPLAGWVVGRVGTRGPFVVAVFRSAATTAAYGMAAGFAVFLAARALWGFCWSFLRLGGYLAALGTSEPGARGFALGFFNGVANVGTLVAVLGGGILTERIGFRSTAFLFAAVAILAGLAMWRERPAPAVGKGVLGPRGGVGRAGPLDAAPRGRRWAVYAASFVNGATGSGLALATLGLWLVEVYGPSVEIASLTLGVASLNGALLATRFAAGVVWAPTAGHLSDRHGHIRFLAAAGAVVVVSLIGLSLRMGLLWTVAVSVLLFFAGTAVRVALDATAGDLASPEARARVMSWYANASDLGAAVGPFVAYQLAGEIGLDSIYRGGAACLTLAGLAAVLVLRNAGSR